MVGNDTNVEPPKGSEDMSSEWVVNGNNMSNTSSGIITMASSMMEVSSCPSAPVVDSFCPPIWNQPINEQSLGYGNMNVQNDPSSLGHVRPGLSWMPNAMLRDSVFLPTSLPPFPADSAFIERAARFSCFNGGSYSELVNPFSIPDPLNPHPAMQEVFTSDRSKQSPGIEPQKKHGMNMSEISKLGKNDNQGSLFKNEKKSPSNDEVRNDVNVLNNPCDEAEFSGRGTQEELAGIKKRKRTQQITENSEASKPDADAAKEKGDQNPSSTSNLGLNHGNQEPQGSDPPKEDYIHVRARRGQATNSHSLAERIRREKISERMKFLQDLVPGCSKVTGKAVMLDEIINYVQSLQRQVEFLSMKLATVNPRLDFNMEGFLTKDIVQSRGGLSSLLAFPPDTAMHFPPLHPPQHGLNQAGFQRAIRLDSTSVCGGLSEPTSQHMQATASVWDTELHNVVHNSFDSTAPSNTQDLTDHMKAEP